MNPRIHTTPPARRRRERGSALVISTLVMVILTLLGISYLTLADTESLIALNMTYQEQALYAAESGARITVSWFNDPDPASGMLVPTVAQVDRSQRWIDHDDNPTTATITNGGTPVVEGDATKPFYRDGLDDLFEKPYRGSMVVGFMGDEDGPDLVIDAAAGGNQAAYLNTLNAALFGTYPSDVTITTAADAKVRARITRIEIYQPPLVNLSGTWTRFGMATVRVTAGVFTHAADTDASNDREVARRVVRAVINETPYPGPTGPLTSCNTFSSTGEFSVYWGESIAFGNVAISTNYDSKFASTFPYAIDSATSHIYEDPLGAPGNSDDFDNWYANWQGQTMEDPWNKFVAGGEINALGSVDIQPFDPEIGTAPDDHSNLFQNLPAGSVPCPSFEYPMWKALAQQGGRNTFYLTHAGGDDFKLDGAGTAKSFANWVNDENGFFFFETTDARPPAVDGSNLTPPISPMVPDGFAGFVYLNTTDFRTTGSGSSRPTHWLFPPGEPYVDLNNDGVYDPGEPHVNLQYPTVLADPLPFIVDNTATQTVSVDVDGDGVNETYSTTVGRDSLGLPFQRQIDFYGILYTSGVFQAQGSWAYYGAVVGKRGIGSSSGTPDIYWDDRLAQGQWPPAALKLPRVIISRWDVEL